MLGDQSDGQNNLERSLILMDSYYYFCYFSNGFKMIFYLLCRILPAIKNRHFKKMTCNLKQHEQEFGGGGGGVCISIFLIKIICFQLHPFNPVGFYPLVNEGEHDGLMAK